MHHILCKIHQCDILILYIIINIIHFSMLELSRKFFNLYNGRAVSFINKYYYDSYNLTSKVKASLYL